jgi:hypothetical protein
LAGAPFAPALKAGSWPLLSQMNSDAATSPDYLRADGQSVRYLHLPSVACDPVAAGAILLLDRRNEGAAEIEPVEPLEVLTALLGSAYSARGALSRPALEALIVTIERARTGRLRFSDWRAARAVVEAFAP